MVLRVIRDTLLSVPSLSLPFKASATTATHFALSSVLSIHPLLPENAPHAPIFSNERTNYKRKFLNLIEGEREKRKNEILFNSETMEQKNKLREVSNCYLLITIITFTTKKLDFFYSLSLSLTLYIVHTQKIFFLSFLFLNIYLCVLSFFLSSLILFTFLTKDSYGIRTFYHEVLNIFNNIFIFIIFACNLA